jgi:hypothetical protein
MGIIEGVKVEEKDRGEVEKRENRNKEGRKSEIENTRENNNFRIILYNNSYIYLSLPIFVAHLIVILVAQCT